MGLVSELRRRNVLRMAAFYVVAAWLVMQVAEVLMGLGKLPDEFGLWVLFALAIGFPVALFVSWFFDLTAVGIVRESRVPEGQPVLAVGGRRTDFVIIAMLVAAVILLLVWEPPAQSDDTMTVLPFESMTGPDEAFFSEGMSIELQNLLAQLRRFKVKQPPAAEILSRFSDVPSLAEEMNVRWVIKGSVRRSEQRVRVSVQLIDVEDDAAIVWSNVFDRELTSENLFTIQSEIARSVTSELRQSLDLTAEKRLAESPTQDIEAYSAYLLGRQRLTDLRIDWIEDAVVQFTDAIALDPNYGNAYSGLADACYLYKAAKRGGMHDQCPEDAAEIVSLTRKAVKLAPDSGEAWVSLGKGLSVYLYSSVDPQSDEFMRLHAEAEAAYQHGLALNPSYSLGYHWYARFVIQDFSVRPAARSEAKNIVEQGLEVDPLSLQLHSDASAWADSREQSLRHARRMVEIAPDSSLAHDRLSSVLWIDHGRIDESLSVSSSTEKKLDTGKFGPTTLGGLAYTALGDYEMALRYFQHERESGVADVRFYEAMAILQAGNWSEATQRLEALLPTEQGRLALPVLSALDVKFGRPEDALARYREHLPECLEKPETSIFERACLSLGLHHGLVLARVLEAAGDSARTQEIVQRVHSRWKTLWPHGNPTCNFLGASIYALLGRHEQALSALEDEVGQGCRGLPDPQFNWRGFAYYDIRVDAIRDHPRYKAAIAVMEADIAQQLENVRAMQLRGELPTLAELNSDFTLE